ncbi:hypothetical protein LINPERHAP2_LOCUS45088 [Linum perenne]
MLGEARTCDRKHPRRACAAQSLSPSTNVSLGIGVSCTFWWRKQPEKDSTIPY